ncbi:hypothetical protein BK636_05445 [Pseudomonas chlororaphis]|nr:hypothetical protein BK636_05445 [Pseudomonas chlororaphis]
MFNFWKVLFQVIPKLTKMSNFKIFQRLELATKNDFIYRRSFITRKRRISNFCHLTPIRDNRKGCFAFYIQ